MSRKVFLAVSAVVMLVLALVVVRFFRDPVPVASQDAVIGGVGASVSGPLTLDGESGKPALPSAQSMVMSTGDSSGDTLRVSEAAPVAGDHPSQAATMVRDSASSSALVTEPPSSPVAPEIVSPSTPAAVSSAQAPVQSAAQPGAQPAAQPSAQKPESRADETPAASGGKAGVTGAYGIAASATPQPATRESTASTPEAAKSATQTPVQASSPKTAQPEAPAKTEPAQKQPETAPAAKTAAADDAPVKPGTLVTKSSLAAKAGSPTVTAATLSMDGDVVTLRLTGSQALKGKTFQLKNPDRVVLDLDGLWSVDAPRVPSNRMLGALRVGNQAQATRLVFDMKVTPGKASVTQINANTIELRIR